MSNLAKIPSDWRLDTATAAMTVLPRNVLPLMSSSTILSDREREITNAIDATALLEQIQGGQWTAEEVTVAFCKRAAVAHQLVNCLADIDFAGAIADARRLDLHFQSTGRIVGPLHGLPVSIKVTSQISFGSPMVGLIGELGLDGCQRPPPHYGIYLLG